jgi:P-type Mg2+ transporter
MAMTAVPARDRDALQPPSAAASAHPTEAFWTRGTESLCAALDCGLDGLGAADAQRRLEQYGPNSDAGTRTGGALRAVLRRLLEPLALILLTAGLVSVVTGDVVGGLIIVAILGLSVGLDTVQEGHATRASEALRHAVALKAEVRRDGRFITVPVDQVVPGDILRVRAGDIVPADALVIASEAVTVPGRFSTG